MNDLQLRHYHTTEQLRGDSDRWDDLWQRSDVLHPTARANQIANWVDHFSDSGSLSALAVEQDGRLVAALPLVRGTVKNVIPVVSLPCNEWASSGDLLIDPVADKNRALDTLVSGLIAAKTPTLWLDHVAITQRRWRAFRAACERCALSTSVREHYLIGQTKLRGTWSDYEKTLSSNHRRNRKKQVRLLEGQGPTELVVHENPAADEIERLLRTGFEVEDRSWKHATGTSVLQNPPLFDFYLEEARQLAICGQLELCFLMHDGQPIAFVYGHQAKGAHFTAKIGYDEQYSKFGPGQQLIMRLLQRYYEDDSQQIFDFDGPILGWSASWSNRSYPVGRLVAATPGALNLGLFHAYENVFPRIKQLHSLFRASLPSIHRRPAA